MNKTILILVCIFFAGHQEVYAGQYKPDRFMQGVEQRFSSDPTSTTARADHFSLSLGVQGLSGVDTSSQPTGFQTSSSNETGIAPIFGMNGRFKMVGLEYRPFATTTNIGTEYYGSSLGGLNVSTSNVLVAKLYCYEWRNLSFSIGAGVEYTSISGAVEMGGYKFPTTGNGWSPLGQVEVNYYLNRYWWLTIGYEKTNVQIVTKIPDTGNLATGLDDQFTFKATFGLY